MKLTKIKLAAAAAIAALGLGAAMPASATLLTYRITDSGSGNTYICVDNDPITMCDTNLALDQIGLDATLANAGLAGAGLGFTIVSASASAANTLNLAQIDKSGNVTATFALGLLSIIFEASKDNFTLLGGNPRTMSTSGSANFTNSVDAGDQATIEGFNNPNNVLFGGGFATPLILLNPPSGAGCFGSGPINCGGASSISGIIEPDLFSLTNRFVITTGESTPGNVVSVQFTDSLVKFAVVPEPTSLLLVGAAMLGLGAVSRRKKS